MPTILVMVTGGISFNVMMNQGTGLLKEEGQKHNPMSAGWNAPRFLIAPRGIEVRQNPAVWNNRSSVNLNNAGLSSPNNPNSAKCSSVALSLVPSNHNHASLNAGVIMVVGIAVEMAKTEEEEAEETDKM